MSDTYIKGQLLVTGNEFLKKLKKLGKARGVSVEFSKNRGKGSHGTVYFGDRRTVMKDLKKEIGPGLLKSMCSNLGISLDELNT